MARFVNTQNVIVGLHESGTYQNASGNFWPGLVQSHKVVPSEGIFHERYLGGTGRDYDLLIQGPIMFKGQLDFHPQDFRFLAWAAGSNVDAGSPSPFTHVITPTGNDVGNAFTSGTLNPFLSFGIQETNTTPGTGNNWQRTFKGAIVDTFELSGKLGQILEAKITYIATSGAYTSGAATAINAFNYGLSAIGSITDRPYIFSDVTMHIPSGTVHETLTDFTFKLNNNLLGRAYLTGSRNIAAPLPLVRDIDLTLGFDAQSERSKTLYESYYVGGSLFNCMLFGVASPSGSRDFAIILSGCKIVDPYDADMQLTGIMPNTLHIKPTTGSAFVCNVNDLLQKYNPY